MFHTNNIDKMHSFTMISKCLLWLCLVHVLGGSFCKEDKNGENLVVSLRHRGFEGFKSLTPFKMLKISVKRSSNRLQNLRKRHSKKPSRKKNYNGFSFPLSASSDYMMPVRIGTPPQELQVYMDTGSDLVWVPCSTNSSSSKSNFECILCAKHTKIPTFFTSKSESITSLPCSSEMCTSIHNSNNNNDICTMAGCPFHTLEVHPCKKSCPPFYYAYGDGSLRGSLFTDKMTLHTIQRIPPQEMDKFIFGCADMTLGEPVGIAGFGKGALSLPYQLSKIGSKSFSYCLVSHKFDDNLHVSSPLYVGPYAIPRNNKIQYTPMLNNAKHPTFYYLDILGISVGNQMLKLPSRITSFNEGGNGGTIIDSGTTFSMIPESLHRQALKILKSEIHYSRSRDYEEALGLDLCYIFPSRNNGSFSLPNIYFNFQNNATISISPENYMFMVSDEAMQTSAKRRGKKLVGCFIIMSSGKVSDGPSAVLGNYQQQNLHVVYDMENQRIGFEQKTCIFNPK